MSDENSANVDRDEFADRLIDRGLREVVGGEKPPNLSDRILAAAGAGAGLATPAAKPSSKWPKLRRQRSRWGELALAVCLLIGAAFLLLPAIPAARESARRSAENADAVVVHKAKPLSTIDDAEGYRYALVEGLAEAPGRDGGGSASSDSAGLGLQRGSATPLRMADDARHDAPANGTPLVEAEPVAEHRLSDLSSTSGADSAGGGQQQGEQGEQPAGQPADLGAQGMGNELDLRSETAEMSDGAASANSTSEGQGQGEGQAAAPGSGTWGWSDPAAIKQRMWNEGRGGRRGLDSEGNDDAYYLRQLAMDPNGDRLADEKRILLGVRKPNQPLAEAETRLQVRVKSVNDLVPELGSGPQSGGDQYAPIIENAFRAISPATTDNRLSTFSIDVDTASYANVRQFLMESNMLPPPDAVRIEELVNYFDYNYSAPTGDVPFDANVEVAACPWKPEHRLVRVGIKGREMERNRRPKSNLVFLVDVSGSMDEPNKLPLVLEGLRMLTRELGENDRIAIVVYASTEGLVLDSTRGDQQQTIVDALNRLSAGGSTAGGAGIVLAYKLAEQNFIKDGVNRVILCTDGDFNVGVTSTGDLQRLAEEKAKASGVFLTVLGFGRGNLNDQMMEAIADHGNGNYHYVDNRTEARKVLVKEMTGTLVTIAKDVKIQIEFNPAQVAGYRLIGYENRVLAAQDFNDDKKDAGEIGAGHTVTALYEIVPAGQKVDATAVDELKYAPIPPSQGEAASAGEGEDAPARYATQGGGASNELLTLKIRYKQPDGDTSTKLEFPISDNGQAFAAASQDFQFASAVAGFGMLLRGSQYKGDASFAGVLEIAESASRDRDPHGYRREFCEMVTRAKELAGY